MPLPFFLGALLAAQPAMADTIAVNESPGSAIATAALGSSIETDGLRPVALVPDIAFTLPAAQDGGAPPPPPPQVYGPPAPAIAGQDAPDPSRYTSFGAQVGAVKWELAGLVAYVTAVNIDKLFKETQSFAFKDEGLFGDNTPDLGVDKLGHAFNGYLASELFNERISRKTGNAPGSALTAAVLGFGVQLYGELYDGIEPGGGFSWGDVGFNAMGSAFSYVRNTVPGLKQKLDFRVLVMPNDNIYTFRGKEHFRQQRFLLALQLSGFERFRNSPLRFLELHAGYYASGFTFRERAQGKPLDQRPFIGIGINLKQLFFRNARSTPARVARTVLDYVQIPYTAVHVW